MLSLTLLGPLRAATHRPATSRRMTTEMRSKAMTDLSSPSTSHCGSRLLMCGRRGICTIWIWLGKRQRRSCSSKTRKGRLFTGCDTLSEYTRARNQIRPRFLSPTVLLTNAPTYLFHVTGLCRWHHLTVKCQEGVWTCPMWFQRRLPSDGRMHKSPSCRSRVEQHADRGHKAPVTRLQKLQ